LKTNKVNLFVSSVLFVFLYHSPKFLDTPRIIIFTNYTVFCSRNNCVSSKPRPDKPGPASLQRTECRQQLLGIKMTGTCRWTTKYISTLQYSTKKRGGQLPMPLTF
jgi:hypothetical protein